MGIFTTLSWASSPYYHWEFLPHNQGNFFGVMKFQNFTGRWQENTVRFSLNLKYKKEFDGENICQS
jgi:hypothetical protein